MALKMNLSKSQCRLRIERRSMAVNAFFKKAPSTGATQSNGASSAAGKAAPRGGAKQPTPPGKTAAKAGKPAAKASVGSKAGKSNSKAPAANNDSKDAGALTGAAALLAEVVASPLFYLVGGLAAIKLVSSFGETAGSILLFASAPITLLTALSKSSLGEQVQASLNEKLPQLEADAAELRAAQAEAREANTKWYGPDRVRFPGSLGAAKHLTGLAAGDYGFDPLGLGTDPAKLARYSEAEMLHARWAMLAAIGCIVPEALASNGVAIGEPRWWAVGAYVLNNDVALNWGGIEGFRIAGKQGIVVIAACQLVLMGGPEYARYVGIKSLEPVGVFLPGEPLYPGGGPFDPLSLSSDAAGFADQAVKEIKHGRMAMVAMLGYFVQAAVTGKGPLENLNDFLDDPAANNVFGALSGAAH